MKTNIKKLFPTALVLYLMYFIHGIGASILGQFKPELAAQWGQTTLADGSIDVSQVVLVIAALGLGKLVALPIAGPLSDRFGRKLSVIIGCVTYIAFFVGVIFSPNMYVAYFFALLGGIGNSFLDTGVIPANMDILVESTGLASLLTKFFISIGQFSLPMMITFMVTRNLSYEVLFYLLAIALTALLVLAIVMPFPPEPTKTADGKTNTKLRLNGPALAIIAIGFTSSATFMIWLNCNQELAKSYGMENPSIIQSYYSVGTFIAVILTGILVSKFVKQIRILLVYPLISLIMLIIVYFIQTPTMCIIAGFVLGFFAAGGVLQLCTSTLTDMLPHAKGKVTSLVMIACSIANYAMISVAGMITSYFKADGPRYVLLLNIVVTTIGILLAVYLNINERKTATKVVTE